MDNQNNNIYSNDNVNSDDFNAGDNINAINNVNADNDINAGNRINNSASDNRGNIGDLYGMNDLRRNAQPPRKKKSQGFASGMIIGAVSAFMAVILLILSVAAVCIAKGYIHIGVNGDVYIQSDAVTDSDGIGSEVEGKLNAIDSVLESFYFGDVDDETAKDNIYKAYLSSYGDKYTMYYTADEYKALKESTNGKFYGIGAVCQLSGEGGVLLVDVYDNGAADHRGLRHHRRGGGGLRQLSGHGRGHHRPPRVPGDAAPRRGGGGSPPTGLRLPLQASGRLRRGAEAGAGAGRLRQGGRAVRPVLHAGGYRHRGRCDADVRREPHHRVLRAGGSGAFGFHRPSRAAAGGGTQRPGDILRADRLCAGAPHQCRRAHGRGGHGGGAAAVQRSGGGGATPGLRLS